MSQSGFYGVARARRSLWHFLGGKVLSAITGIVFLVAVVRLAVPAEYGKYVVLLAVLEIFYLATGLGLSTMAQRYVAEFRVQAPHAQFVRFVNALLLRRAAAALAGAIVVLLAWPWLLAALRLELPAATRWWLGVWLVVGCGTRYLDEVLPALLLQGASQLLSTGSNLLRLLALMLVSSQHLAVDHLTLVCIELGVATLAWAVGLALLQRYLRQALPAQSPTQLHQNPRMWAVATRFYAVQLLGQAWSPNMARLLVSRLAGAAQAATFGFCQSLVDILRNYLPSYLLATWVRPLMVARYVATGKVDPVMDLAGAVFKLSLLTLVPFFGPLLLHGDALAQWISAGRYGTGAGPLMAALVLLLALQALHLCLGMVSTTLERAGANIWATGACAAALPVAAALWPWLGLLAVPAALCVAEVLWVLWVAVALRRAGFGVTLHWVGHAKVLLAGAAAWLVAMVWPPVAGPALVLLMAAAGGAALLVSVLLRPLHARERALFEQVLPRRWLLL